MLIAGGIGITPLKGMAEYAADRALPIPVRLVYSNRAEEEIPYRAELRGAGEAKPSIQRPAHPHGRRPEGVGGLRGPHRHRLLRDAVRGLERPVYYVCGKTGMVEEMLRLLSESGVKESDVLVEVFRGYRELTTSRA